MILTMMKAMIGTIVIVVTAIVLVDNDSYNIE